MDAFETYRAIQATLQEMVALDAGEEAYGQVAARWVIEGVGWGGGWGAGVEEQYGEVAAR
jgi:hypothetical protein